MYIYPPTVTETDQSTDDNSRNYLYQPIDQTSDGVNQLTELLC